MIPKESWLPGEGKRVSDRGGLMPQGGVSFIPTAQTQLRASHFGAKKSRGPTVLGISKLRLSGRTLSGLRDNSILFLPGLFSSGKHLETFSVPI